MLQSLTIANGTILLFHKVIDSISRDMIHLFCRIDVISRLTFALLMHAKLCMGYIPFLFKSSMAAGYTYTTFLIDDIFY